MDVFVNRKQIFSSNVLQRSSGIARDAGSNKRNEIGGHGSAASLLVHSMCFYHC